MAGNVDQDFSHAKAGANIVAGDYFETKNFGDVSALKGSISELVRKFEAECANDEKTVGWIEDLLFFEENVPDDDVVGLEEKLKAAGSKDKTLIALKQKEHFAKFLERTTLYGSAQKLLALCLHRIFSDFEVYVHPFCGLQDSTELHKRIYEKIVCPVVDDYCQGSFSINHTLVLGMTYWLADRCYIRWHKVSAE